MNKPKECFIVSRGREKKKEEKKKKQINLTYKQLLALQNRTKKKIMKINFARTDRIYRITRSIYSSNDFDGRFQMPGPNVTKWTFHFDVHAQADVP